MDKQHNKQIFRKFKVYYFYGDWFSSKGEELGSTIVMARTEDEAERVFINLYQNRFNHRSVGWIEEI